MLAGHGVSEIRVTERLIARLQRENTISPPQEDAPAKKKEEGM